MSEKNINPYQKAIDFLIENDVKCQQSISTYKLLFKLANFHKIDMNGGKNHIMKEFGYSKNKIKKLSEEAVLNFCKTGTLYVPNEFCFRERKNYKHDCDATANRNVWKESNKALKDNPLKPILYSKNTKK